MTESPRKPLSEKPLGYVLAAVGGLLGGPLGLVVSPAVLFGLTKVMKPKEEKHPNRFLVWALIGVVGAPLTISPFFTDTSKDNAGSQDSAKTTQPQQSDLVPLGSVEQVREDRSLAVTVSKEYSSISTDNQFMEPLLPKGGRLLGVFMTIKNTGNESGNMFWTHFQLEDSQGRKYDDIADFTEIVTLNAWAKANGLAETGDQLFPGATANTVAVFRVAPDARNLRLVVNGTRYFSID